MQIKLNEGTILEAIHVNGGSRFYQNANRDCLEYVFDATQSMDALHATFSDRENVRQVTLITPEGEEHIHEGYVIHVSTSRENVVIAPETATAPELTEQRIKIVMGQQTFTEKTLEQLMVNQK